MRLRDRPIQYKFFILFLAICLIPALVFLGLFGLGTRLTFEQTMGQDLSTRAEYLSEQFDRFLGSRLAYLRTLAERADTGPDQVATEAMMRASVDAAALVTDRGAVRSLGPGQHQLVERVSSYTPFFGSWWDRLESLPKEGVLTDVALRLPGRTKAVVLCAFVVPVADATGQARGEIVFFYDPSLLMSQFRATLASPPEFMLVQSSNGYPVRGEEGIGEELGERVRAQATIESDAATGYFLWDGGGNQSLLAHSESKLMRSLRSAGGMGAVWTFVLEYDMTHFLAPHEERIWLGVLIGLGLVLVLLAVSSVVAGVLVRPLHALQRSAEQLASGELEVRAKVYGKDEIGALASSFNQMAERLRKTLHSLEEEVVLNRVRGDHIHAINELANAVIQTRDMDQIFGILTRELGKIVRYDAVWLTLLDHAAQDLHVMQIEPAGMITLFEDGKLPLGGSYHGQAAEGRATLRVEVSPDDTARRFEHSLLEAEGLRSYLIAPLPAKDRLIGTLTIASEGAATYGEEESEIADSLARAVAIAIEQADLFQQISHFALELERKVAERTHELEQANQKLIQTEKYFATGRLAGNLAHEINNPLGIIKNYLELVRKNLTRSGGGRRATDPNLEHVRVINEEVDRIASLIRQLLNLHRPVEQAVKPVDVNAMLDSILTLMETNLERHRIEVERHFGEDLPRPVVSSDLLRQVLINLLRNAQDAMEKGGRLRIATSGVRDAETPEVQIRIRDEGVGIPAEHLSRIFDPFFTTKPQEKGTGLGLCVSYSIVRMYRGTIEVDSRVGQGTCVTVTLPVIARARGERQTVEELAEATAKGETR